MALKDLFGGSKDSGTIGVDLGSSGAKIVELTQAKGRSKLVTYGQISEDLKDLEYKTSGFLDVDKTASALKNLCRQAKTKSSSVVSSLPGFLVFSSIVTFTNVNKKQLPKLVEREIAKLIDKPVEEMVVNYNIVEEFEDNQEKNPKKKSKKNQSNEEQPGIAVKRQNFYRVLITAADKEIVQMYTDIFSKAGLNLQILEPDTFALVRSLVGADKSAIMLVDIGSLTTNVSIVYQGYPLLMKSVDTGGLVITRAISNSLKISLTDSEQIKKDLWLAKKNNKAGQALPDEILTGINPIVNLINYLLNDLRANKKYEINDVEKIILTGGSAYLADLPEYLSKIIDKKVYIGDPWARVIYPDQLKPVLEEIGPRFSVAVGLAQKFIAK